MDEGGRNGINGKTARQIGKKGDEMEEDDYRTETEILYIREGDSEGERQKRNTNGRAKSKRTSWK